MSQEQKDALDRMLREGPLDLGGDVAQQRAIFEEMVSQIPANPDGPAAVADPGRPTRVLLSDATRLAARAAAADVTTTLDVVAGVPHVFQAFAAMLDEASGALDRAASFIALHLAE